MPHGKFYIIIFFDNSCRSLVFLLCSMQSDRFFNALKGHGALCRLVILPFESHGYAARESIMHVLWETDRWLQKYCISNITDPSAEHDESKENVSTEAADSDSKAVATSGGGSAEVSDLEIEASQLVPRSLCGKFFSTGLSKM